MINFVGFISDHFEDYWISEREERWKQKEELDKLVDAMDKLANLQDPTSLKSILQSVVRPSHGALLERGSKQLEGLENQMQKVEESIVGTRGLITENDWIGRDGWVEKDGYLCTQLENIRSLRTKAQDMRKSLISRKETINKVIPKLGKGRSISIARKKKEGLRKCNKRKEETVYKRAHSIMASLKGQDVADNVFPEAKRFCANAISEETVVCAPIPSDKLVKFQKWDRSAMKFLMENNVIINTPAQQLKQKEEEWGLL